MVRHAILLLFASSLGGAAPAAAQLPEWVTDILAATRLPVVADSARREGTSNEAVREALEAMAKSRLPAHEATVILDSARVARREHGPVDNFGAFVQAQLAEGKRGRELAAAIRAEHARMGKGAAGRAGAQPGRADDNNDRSAAGRGRGQGQGAARAGGRDTSARPDSSLGKQDNRGRGKGRPGNPDR